MKYESSWVCLKVPKFVLTKHGRKREVVNSGLQGACIRRQAHQDDHTQHLTARWDLQSRIMLLAIAHRHHSISWQDWLDGLLQQLHWPGKQADVPLGQCHSGTAHACSS